MEDKLTEITAKTVTVEVTDEATGKVYRRTLPIDYYENANLLKLQGENLDGTISHSSQLGEYDDKLFRSLRQLLLQLLFLQ